MIKKICFFFLFSSFWITAQNINPLIASDASAQEQWVDSIMNKMSVDQKIGQLFMVAAYSNKDANHTAELSRMIQRYHVGNVIFMKGTPERQVRLNNLLQSKAKVPLLVGFDGEWGLDMRLKNTYRFPWNMTLGAIRNNRLLEKLGKRLGEHCKRVGIHVNFAPVLDINTNPKNPIIGNRSFGESKENVTKKAIAFTIGMQSVGVLANGKHFPGHGDTSQDSHKTLPEISFSAKRIDSIELYPYKKLFKSGMASVMVAHLRIPSLEVNPDLPSSLSKNVVTTILKDSLQFKGLIFTDGLNMKGAADFGTPAEVNLRAFLAGNDVLLIPDGIPQTIQLFKKSLRNGTITQTRLNHSVKKILQAKYLVGLHQYNPISTENIHEDLNSTENEILHRKLVESSLTLVKNDESLLPIKDVANKKIAYVKFGNAPNDEFVDILKKYTDVDVVYSKKLNWLMGALRNYDTVIVGFHKSNKNPWQSYKFSDKELNWLQEIARTKKVILDVFASPYALLQLKSYTNIDAVLVSYQNSKFSQELSAQAIFGAVPIRGRLPVSIKNEFKVGEGITTKSLQRLQYSFPEDVGMSSDSLKIVDKHIQTILKKRMAPGGQILVARHGKVIYNKSFGYHTTAKKRKVKDSDVYDLASLTKILATLPMIMKAKEDYLLSIESNLGQLMPSFLGSNKDTLSVKEVLSHFGRLAAWIPFYKRTQSEKGVNLKKYYSTFKTDDFSIKVADKMYLSNAWKDSISYIIKTVDQKPTLRYKYSDVGYYIFKDFLEQNYEQRLDALVYSNFYSTMGLDRTSYLPLDKFSFQEIVPSEIDTYFRNQTLRGYVHDMGAAMQGGVGGHAGLFSNANDVAKIMQFYLQGGYYGGKRYLKQETINEFNTRYYSKFKNRRGLGFDKSQINPKEKPTCDCVSDRSFGHSGFTGTYTWADPESGIVYVFLSNRTYPTMANKGLVKSNIRTKIQKTIQNAIIE